MAQYNIRCSKPDCSEDNPILATVVISGDYLGDEHYGLRCTATCKPPPPEEE